MTDDPLVTFRPAYSREPVTVPLSDALQRGYHPPEDDAPTVVIYASRGAGKTRFAEALKAMFGCTSIVDEWDGVTPVRGGALVLTNVPPNALRPDTWGARKAKRHAA